MVMRPASVCLGETNNVHRQALKALMIIPIIFKSIRMGEAFDILEEDSNRTLYFRFDRVPEGGMR